MIITTAACYDLSRDWITMISPENTDSTILAEIMVSRGPLNFSFAPNNAEQRRTTPNNVKLSTSVSYALDNCMKERRL
jgi:hypothetical protein